MTSVNAPKKKGTFFPIEVHAHKRLMTDKLITNFPAFFLLDFRNVTKEMNFFILFYYHRVVYFGDCFLDVFMFCYIYKFLLVGNKFCCCNLAVDDCFGCEIE